MKAIKFRSGLLAAMCGVALVVAALSAHTYAMRSGAAEEPPINPPIDARTAADWKNGFAIQFRELPPPSGSIRVNDAVASAIAKYGDLASAQYAPGAYLAAARCGRMTMGHYYRKLLDGTREYPIHDRLVWVLTYAHASIPYTGPPPPGTNILINPPKFEAEANVVVDASTGEAVDMFAIGRRVG